MFNYGNFKSYKYTIVGYCYHYRSVDTLSQYKINFDEFHYIILKFISYLWKIEYPYYKFVGRIIYIYIYIYNVNFRYIDKRNQFTQMNLFGKRKKYFNFTVTYYPSKDFIKNIAWFTISLVSNDPGFMLNWGMDIFNWVVWNWYKYAHPNETFLKQTTFLIYWTETIILLKYDVVSII